MADIDTSSGGKKGGNKRKKLSTRVDLTPMVDLGFLLITFFIFTTTMAKPKAMEITLPAETPDTTDQTKAKKYLTLTFLLSKENRVYYYKGIGDDPMNPPDVKLTYFKPQDGVRQVIIDHVKEVNDYKQKYAGKRTGVKDDDAATIILKPDSNSTYHDLINALDELQIMQIKKKALVEISDVEREFIRKTEESNGE